MNSEKRATEHADAPLVSGTSIVILSAFLFGMFSTRLVQPGMEHLVLFAGAVGLISYLGLETASRNVQARRVMQQRKKVARRLEKTFDKHLAHHQDSATRPQQRRRRVSPEDSQYVTVVTRPRGL